MLSMIYILKVDAQKLAFLDCVLTGRVGGKVSANTSLMVLPMALCLYHPLTKCWGEEMKIPSRLPQKAPD